MIPDAPVGHEPVAASGAEDPLDHFLGRLSERSIGWVARRAEARGAEVAGKPDGWIEQRLDHVSDALRSAPSKSEVVRPWKRGEETVWALALEGEHRRRRELGAGRAQADPGRDTRAAGDEPDVDVWVELPPHHRELLGEWRAERLVRAAGERRARLERHPTEFIDYCRAQPGATLPSLDDHTLAWAAEYVALRREQLAREDMRRAMSSPSVSADLEASARQQAAAGSVHELIEQCGRNVGGERRNLVVAHAAALVPTMEEIEPTTLATYAESLRLRLADADRGALTAAARLDTEHRTKDELHDWRSTVAEAAAARAAERGKRRPQQERRELERLAELHRSEASYLEPDLDRCTEKLREARRQHTHPDNWTDPFARLVAAEAVIQRRIERDVSPRLAVGDEAPSRARDPHREIAPGNDFGVEM